MTYILDEITKSDVKESIAREILLDLPDWFGLSESTENYIVEGCELPFIAVFDKTIPVGFIILKPSSPDCAELFVMGVKQAYHRKGIGRQLYQAYEKMAQRLSYTYSQVKTVQTGSYEIYDRTNQFYQAMGYKELECFPTLWDEWNPCQVYIKFIG